MNKGFLILLTTTGLLSGVAEAMTALEIMTQNESARKVSDFQTKAELSTGPVNEKDRKTKQFTLWRKIQADGIHNSTLTRFHQPAEVRGEGILITENAAGKNDVLLYLPTFKKIRRVETQQQSGSFMGSTFSYSDIATPHVEDFTYSLVREEKCPTTEAKDQSCFVVACVPANEAVRDRTGYSKSMIWVRKDNFMGVAGHYFDEKGVHFKSLEANQVRMIDTAKKKWLAHSVTMTNLKKNEMTLLDFKEVKANQGISDSVFSQQNLQKVK